MGTKKKVDVDPMSLSLRASQVLALRKFVQLVYAEREGVDEFFDPRDDLSGDELSALDAVFDALGVEFASGGARCDACGGRFDDVRDGLCSDCDGGDTSCHPEEHSCHDKPYCDCDLAEFKVQLDFSFEKDLDAEASGVCDQHGIDAWYLVELNGPAGGNPVVEFRGTHASLKSLCDARQCDEGEFIEAVGEGDEPAKGIELQRRPWKKQLAASDGGAVMAIVLDAPPPTVPVSTKDFCVRLAHGLETGGGELTDAQVEEALS